MSSIDVVSIGGVNLYTLVEKSPCATCQVLGLIGQPEHL